MSGFYQRGDNPEVTVQAQQWADLSMRWAIDLSGPVEGGEYSSKYHALEAAQSAATATTEADRAEEAANSIDPKQLGDLTDVDVPAPVDQQALVWVAANSKWEAKTISGGGAGDFLPLDGSAQMTATLEIAGGGTKWYLADGTTERIEVLNDLGADINKVGIRFLDTLGNNGVASPLAEILAETRTTAQEVVSNAILRSPQDAAQDNYDVDLRYRIIFDSAAQEGEGGFTVETQDGTAYGWFGPALFGTGVNSMQLFMNRPDNLAGNLFIQLRSGGQDRFVVEADGSVNLISGAQYKVNGVPIDGGGGGGVTDIDNGAGISIDKTDPAIPVISANLPYFQSEFVPKAGGTFDGNISVPDPIEGGHAATNQWVTFNFAPVTRNINVGDGLTGGGDLSADVGLAVDGSVVRTSGNQSIEGGKNYISLGGLGYPGCSGNPFSTSEAANIAYVNAVRSDHEADFHGSDARLKENITDTEYGLHTILDLEPCEFDWKGTGQHAVGLIAQSVQQVIPEAVMEQSEAFGDTLMLDDRALIAVLVRAVQTLADRVEELENT